MTIDAQAGARTTRLMRWLTAVLVTTRPRQWPKNLLVFAAPLAGGSLGRDDGLGYALVAATAFVCASAAVYLANDVADAERDRQHPRKRHRPVAAGTLPRSHAIVLCVIAAAAAMASGIVISEPLLTVAVGGYLGISFLYSAVLKRIPVVEMVFVASGFLLRVLGGTAATHVPPSGWFLLVCALGAFGVAAAKRYTELVSLGPAAVAHRPVMRRYRPGLLRLTQLAAGAAMIAAYLTWASGQPPGIAYWHLASGVPMAGALIRFGILTGRGTATAVEDLLTRDAVTVSCGLAWLALFTAGL
ncbi:MAG: decaprenyl-phosphate phosphoribosyltransferase [Streptosporangiales bacterium]|jgi:decaprenyl-phosphate phosphoribosyltransferase|nr:decaprenyl-phosphate phosphoribosyltransferase [Streptosporangiales bacterium]